jgi:nucleoside-diphosphate-sugar epimerase
MSSHAGPVLLTGATGFIGPVVARQLVERGHRVLALTRAGRTVEVSGVETHPWPASQSELRDLVRRAGVRTGVHLAAAYVAEHGPDDVADLVGANVGLTAAVADALAPIDGARLITAGTVWQNAAGPGYEPVNLYAATKQAAHDIVAHFTLNTGLAALVIKLPDTYGPGDTRRKAVDLLLDTARTQRPLDMSAGAQVLDLLHVEDVAAAFVLATEAAGWAEPSVALSGRTTTLRALGTIVAAVADQPLPVNWGARTYRARERFTDWDAGPTLAGWKPRIELEDGIRQLWAAGQIAAALDTPKERR